jgi:hypothetical protein
MPTFARPSRAARCRPACLVRHRLLRHTFVVLASSLRLITNNLVRNPSWASDVLLYVGRQRYATGLTVFRSPSHLLRNTQTLSDREIGLQSGSGCLPNQGTSCGNKLETEPLQQRVKSCFRTCTEVRELAIGSTEFTFDWTV